MKWMGKKVGLALGGGGVRGLAHIGVLNVLEQDGIGIDLIVGTSSGALIGGAYASGMSVREITANALEAAELQNADVIIHLAVGDLHWADFSRSDHLIRIGEEATRESLGKINSSLPLPRCFARFALRFYKMGKVDK